MLAGWLDWQRATVRVKCDGLTDVEAYRSLLPSPLTTVAGVVSHLRWVEYGWLERSFLGRAPAEVADWEVSGVPLARLLDEYDAQCARSREIAAAHDLDTLEVWAPPGQELVSLRWILCHLIEETARHLGHIDAIRELIDGSTGS